MLPIVGTQVALTKDILNSDGVELYATAGTVCEVVGHYEDCPIVRLDSGLEFLVMEDEYHAA